MKNLFNSFKKTGTGVLTIGIVYLAFGLAWISFSDAFVQAMFADADSATITSIQTYKGYAYISVTSIFLMLLISNFAKRIKGATKLQEETGNTLKKLIEEVGVGIARLDLDGKFIYANPDFCKFFGYTADELERKSVFELTHPDDYESDKKCWESLLAQDSNDIQKEKRFFNKFNQINWAQEKVTLIVDSNRDPLYVVLVIQDINSLKTAEQKLEEHIKYFQTVLENSFDGVSIVSKEGTIKYQTPSVGYITGQPSGSRLGESAFSFIDAEDMPKVKTIFQQLVSGEVPEMRTVIKYHRANKELRYLDLYVKNMLTDPLINGLVVNFRDITDRFKAESKLVESEEQYKLLFMHNPIPVFIYDLKTLNYLQVNDAAVKNYGYSREEFLQMNLKDIRPREDIEKVLEDLAKLDAGVPEPNKIWRHFTKDGQLKYVEISAIKIHFNGQMVRMSIANDVTHIINNQEIIRQSEERYRHLVENLPAGAVLVQGEDIYFNKAASEITGYSLSEINTLDKWFEKLYSGDAKLIRQYYEEDKAKNFGLARTVSLLTKNGEKKWTTFYAYKFETGEVWLLQDVTEQKKIDERIINSILEAEDRERRRIAEGLHDGLGSLLINANFKLENLKEHLASFSEEQQEQLLACHELLRKAIEGTRSIAVNLIPLNLSDENIGEILKDLFSQTQISTGVNISVENELDKAIVNPTLANNLYRIGQEAMHNILKHEQATHVIIKIARDKDTLVFSIEDNGLGYGSIEDKNGNVELTNITNRVNVFGGVLDIKPIPSGGTYLNIRIPYNFG
ncbi:hypothetical protein BH09BAC1_BH09BAC1_11780 [soil metagenome]